MLPAMLDVAVTFAVLHPVAVVPGVVAAIPVPIALFPRIAGAWRGDHFHTVRWRRDVDVELDAGLRRLRRHGEHACTEKHRPRDTIALHTVLLERHNRHAIAQRAARGSARGRLWRRRRPTSETNRSDGRS